MTIITRSFAENMGHNWPKEWHSKVDGRIVTYAEIKAARVAKQRKWMDWKLKETEHLRAVQVWTFFVPGLIYGGWHLYLRTFNDAWWIRHFGQRSEELMQKFPCGILPMEENFYAWKQSFAETYARPGPERKKQGIVNDWMRIRNGQPVGEFLLSNNKINGRQPSTQD